MSIESSLAGSTQSCLDSGPAALPRFSFIKHSENVNASKTRRAVRSHAMKAVRRQQRQEAPKVIRLKWPEERSSGKKLQLARSKVQPDKDKERQRIPQSGGHVQRGSQEGSVLDGTPLPQWSEPATCHEKCDLPQTETPGYKNLPCEEVKSPDSVKRQDPFPDIIIQADNEVPRTGGSARSLLGSGRIDPFQTFPIHADRSVQRLADHYVAIMPATFYGIRCRKPIHVDLYRIAIRHRASINAMAAYASKSLDFLHCSEPSQSTTNHTMRAVQGVNEGLVAINQRVYERTDDIVYSIAMLAFAELRFGRIEIARQHWIGLREVIRYRGGFDAFDCNHSLKAVLAWNSTVWSASRNSKVLGSSDLPSLVAPETPDDLHLACQVFIDFFHKLNDNAYSHSVYSDPDDSSHTAYPYKSSPSAYKQSLFAPGTPLNRLLKTNLGSSTAISNQRAFDACQMPCLFYISVILLEYAKRPYLTDDFLSRLVNTVYEDNLHICVSPEHLLIRLLVGIDGTETERDARLCNVTRLAYVAKRLGKSSMEKVRRALWENLVLSDGPCRRQRLFAWDPRNFEAEILRD